MTEPRQALDDAGAETMLIALSEKKIKGWKFTKWGKSFTADLLVADANPDDFDALLLPGGVMNPDKLRADATAVAFVKSFFDADKPVAAICHGPIMLIEADVARDRRLTSYHSIKTDLANAGANWVDEPAVMDGNLVTSRQPDDIPQFNEAMLNLFAQEHHAAVA
jgi:protease I